MKVRSYPVLYLPASRPTPSMWARYWRQRQQWCHGPKKAGHEPKRPRFMRIAHCQQLRSVLGLP